jgi:hypothetical protein
MENFEKLMKYLDNSITMRLNQIHLVSNGLGILPSQHGEDKMLCTIYYEVLRTMLLEMANSVGWLMHIQDKALKHKMQEGLPDDSQGDESTPTPSEKADSASEVEHV